MTYYRVTIEDLEAIRTALEAQAQGLDATRTQTQTSVSLLDEVTAQSLTAGLTGVTEQLTSLAEQITRAQELADAAEWTGTDADTFRRSNADLLVLIQQTDTAFAGAVQEYETSSRRLLAVLDDLVADFVATSNTLQDASADLGSAVQLEARSYEEAFNGSFAFGG